MRQLSTSSISRFQLGDARNWRLPLLAVLLLAAAAFGVFFFGVVQAQDANGAITGLTLRSDSPGTLRVSWNTPSPTPTDYRIDWGKIRRELPVLYGRQGPRLSKGERHHRHHFRPGGRRGVQGPDAGPIPPWGPRGQPLERPLGHSKAGRGRRTHAGTHANFRAHC